MTTLLNRCEQLRSRIADYDELRRADREAETFRSRASDLKMASEAIPELINKMGVLRETGVRLSGTRLNPSRALESLQVLRQKFDSDAASIHTGREFGNLRRSLEKLAQDAQAIVHDGLSQVGRELPSVDEVFLKQVERIPAYKDRVMEIRQRRTELLAGRDIHSLSANELRSFLAQRDQLRKLSSSIDPAEIPKSVREFFKSACDPQGASLEKLTDEVRQWLEKQDLLRRVRVILSDR